MRAIHRVAIAAFSILAATFVYEAPAHALGSLSVEFGAKIGGATKPESTALNPYGFGVGGRAGVFVSGFYGGVSAMRYFGETSELPPVGQVSTSSTLLGGEVGYSFDVTLLRVRPQFGIGSANFETGSVSEGHLYLEPGVTGLVLLGLLYVGADVNVLIVPAVERGGTSTTYTSLSVHGQIGLRF